MVLAPLVLRKTSPLVGATAGRDLTGASEAADLLAVDPEVAGFTVVVVAAAVVFGVAVVVGVAVAVLFVTLEEVAELAVIAHRDPALAAMRFMRSRSRLLRLLVLREDLFRVGARAAGTVPVSVVAEIVDDCGSVGADANDVVGDVIIDGGTVVVMVVVVVVGGVDEEAEADNDGVLAETCLVVGRRVDFLFEDAGLDFRVRGAGAGTTVSAAVTG